MKSVTDFFQRNKIDQKAAAIVEAHFTQASLRKIDQADGRAKRKALDKIIDKISLDAHAYSSSRHLGLYGKARLLKSIQEGVKSKQIDKFNVEYVLERLVCLED